MADPSRSGSVVPQHRILPDVEDVLINPLAAVRDIHFISSLMVVGIVFFDLFIASPVLRIGELRLPATTSCFSDRTTKLLWIALALSIVSALAWLCLLSARITGKPFDEVVADGTIWVVLSRTQFGFAWQLRLLLGLALAVFLLTRPAKDDAAPIWQGVLATLLASAYLGSLAFTGHGQEGPGFERNIHLAADFLHLIAAGLWLGGLIPLALLLAYLRRFREENWVSAACAVAGHFSNLGMLAVGILLVSGTFNASLLVGGIENLIDTRYGRWLLLKMTLFAAMVGLAAINRQYLLPRLCGGAGIDRGAPTVQWLVRSARVEIALGLGVIVIVGMIGIMAPATDMTAHVH
jgi:putative copper resistance protein D